MNWRQARRNLFDKPEDRDESLVGITFVDVLFALVVGQILAPIALGKAIPVAGWAHLMLAFILTVTSWIGYHNSWNRPRFFIRFVNLPLMQFLVDVFLVIVYWLTAVFAEGLELEARTASAFPEAVLVMLSFLLYALWDRIGLLIRKSPRFARRPLSKDVPKRRDITGLCFIGAVIIAALVAATTPNSAQVVIAVDCLLVILLIGFRLLKEAVTTPEDRVDVNRDAGFSFFPPV